MGIGVTDRGTCPSGNHDAPDPVMRVCIIDKNVTVPEVGCIEHAILLAMVHVFLTHVSTKYLPRYCVIRGKIGHPRYSAVATASQNAPIHIAGWWSAS